MSSNNNCISDGSSHGANPYGTLTHPLSPPKTLFINPIIKTKHQFTTAEKKAYRQANKRNRTKAPPVSKQAVLKSSPKVAANGSSSEEAFNCCGLSSPCTITRKPRIPFVSDSKEKSAQSFPAFAHATFRRTWHGNWFPDEHNFLRSLRRHCLNTLSNKKTASVDRKRFLHTLLAPSRSLLDLYQESRAKNKKCTGVKFIDEFIFTYSIEYSKRSPQKRTHSLVVTKFVPKGNFQEAIAASNIIGGNPYTRTVNFAANWDVVTNTIAPFVRDVARTVVADYTDRASICTNIVRCAYGIAECLRSRKPWTEFIFAINDFYRSFDFRNPWASNVRTMITDLFPDFNNGDNNPIAFLRYLCTGLSRAFRERFPILIDEDEDEDPQNGFGFVPHGVMEDLIDISRSDLTILMAKVTTFVTSVFVLFSLNPGERPPSLSLQGLSNFATRRIVPILGVAVSSGGLSSFFEEVNVTLNLMYNCIDSVFRGDFARFCGIDSYEQIHALFTFINHNYGSMAPSGNPVHYSGRDEDSCPVTLRLPECVYRSSDPAFRIMIQKMEGRIGGQQCMNWREGNKQLCATLLARLIELQKRGTHSPTASAGLTTMCDSLIRMSKNIPLGITDTKAAGITLIICGKAGTGKSTFVNKYLHSLCMQIMFDQGAAAGYPDIVNSGHEPGQAVHPRYTSCSSLEANFINCMDQNIHFLCRKKDDCHPCNPDAIGKCKNNINVCTMECTETQASHLDAAGLTSNTGQGIKGDNMNRTLLNIFSDNDPTAHLQYYSNYFPAASRRCIFITWYVKEQFANKAEGLDEDNTVVRNLLAAEGNADIFHEVSVNTYSRLANANGIFKFGEQMVASPITYTFIKAARCGLGADAVSFEAGASCIMDKVSVSTFNCYITDRMNEHYRRSFHAYGVRETRASLTPSLLKCSCAGGTSILHCINCAGYPEFCPTTGIMRTLCHHCRSNENPESTIATYGTRDKKSIIVRLASITDLDYSYFRMLLYSPSLRPIMKCIMRRLDVPAIFAAHATGTEWTIAADGGCFVEGGGLRRLLSDASSVQNRRYTSVELWWSKQFPQARKLKDLVSLFFTFILHTPYHISLAFEEANSLDECNGMPPLDAAVRLASFAGGIDSHHDASLKSRLAIPHKPDLHHNLPQVSDLASATWLSLVKLKTVYCLLDMPSRNDVELDTALPDFQTIIDRSHTLDRNTGLSLCNLIVPELPMLDFGTTRAEYYSDFLSRLMPHDSLLPKHTSLMGETGSSEFKYDFEPLARAFVEIHGMGGFAPKVFGYSFFGRGDEEEKDSDIDLSDSDDEEAIDVGLSDSDDDVGATDESPWVRTMLYSDYGFSYGSDSLDCHEPRLPPEHLPEPTVKKIIFDPNVTNLFQWNCPECTGVVHSNCLGHHTHYHFHGCTYIDPLDFHVCVDGTEFAAPKRISLCAYGMLLNNGNPHIYAMRQVAPDFMYSRSLTVLLEDVRRSFRLVWFVDLSPHTRELIKQAMAFVVTYGATKILLNALTSQGKKESVATPEHFEVRGDTIPSDHSYNLAWWLRTADEPVVGADGMNLSSTVTAGAHGMSLADITKSLSGDHARAPASRVARIRVMSGTCMRRMHCLLIDTNSFVCPSHLFASFTPDANGLYDLELDILRSDTSVWVTHKTKLSPDAVSYGNADCDLARVAHGLSALPFKSLDCFYRDDIQKRVQLKGRIFKPTSDVHTHVDVNLINYDPNCLLVGKGSKRFPGGDEIHVLLRDDIIRNCVSHVAADPGKAGDCGSPVAFTDLTGRFPTLGLYIGSVYGSSEPRDIYVAITKAFMDVTSQDLFGSVSGVVAPTPALPFGPFAKMRDKPIPIFRPKMDVVVNYGPPTDADQDVIAEAIANCESTVSFGVKSRKALDWPAHMPGFGGSLNTQNNTQAPLFSYSGSKSGSSILMPVYDARHVKGIYPGAAQVRPMFPSVANSSQHWFVPSLFHLGCTPWFGDLHDAFDGVIVGLVGPGVVSADGSEASMSLDREIAKTMVNAEIPRHIVKKAGSLFLKQTRRILQKLLPRVNKTDLMACLMTTCEDSYYGMYRDDGSAIFGPYDLTTSYGSNFKPPSGSKKRDVVNKTEEGLVVHDDAKASWLAMTSATFLFAMGMVPPNQIVTCFTKDECYPVLSADPSKEMRPPDSDFISFYCDLYGITPDNPFFSIQHGDDSGFRRFFHSRGDLKVKVKSRLVCILPGSVNLAFRMFMMPLLYIYSQFPLHWDFVAGLDLSGPHFEQSTMEILVASWDPITKTFRCFDADVSAWDKIMPTTLTYETLLVMIQLVIDIHVAMDTYNSQVSAYAGALLRWWSEFEVYYRGVLFTPSGIMPSGFVLTLSMNGKMNGLLMVCVMIEYCTRNGIELPDDLSDFFIHKAHGDDSQTAVKPALAEACKKVGVEPFSSRDYTEIMLNWGITATLANKSTHGLVYQEIKDLVFLQHIMRFQWIPAWTHSECLEIPSRFTDVVLIASAPMKPHTLVKMLGGQDEGAGITKPYLLASQVRSLVYELLPYGRARVDRFREAIFGFHCPIWKPDEPEFNDLYIKIFEWNAILSWYVTKFCTDGKMCPSIIAQREAHPDVHAAAVAQTADGEQTSLSYE